jgi:hypothetical protein
MQRLWSFGTPVGAAELTNLFPFSTPYGVFTGKCEEASPILYPGNGDYFPTYTGSVQTDPGERDPVTVRQPPLNIRIRDTSGNFINSSQSPSTNRRVRGFATLRTNTAECSEPVYLLHAMTNPSPQSGGPTAGWPSHTPLGSNGLPQVWDPGLPFGVYDICFDYQTSAGSSNYRRFVVSGYDNTAPLGRSSTLLVPTSTGTGSSSTWSSSGTTVGVNKCAA